MSRVRIRPSASSIDVDAPMPLSDMLPSVSEPVWLSAQAPAVESVRARADTSNLVIGLSSHAVAVMERTSSTALAFLKIFHDFGGGDRGGPDITACRFPAASACGTG